MASSTSSILCAGTCPALLLSRVLSIVRIWLRRTTESDSSPVSLAKMQTFVGYSFLAKLLVMQAMIVTGLRSLPTSFCIIKTGLVLPCSDP